METINDCNHNGPPVVTNNPLRGHGIEFGKAQFIIFIYLFLRAYKTHVGEYENKHEENF